MGKAEREMKIVKIKGKWKKVKEIMRKVERGGEDREKEGEVEKGVKRMTKVEGDEGESGNEGRQG